MIGSRVGPGVLIGEASADAADPPLLAQIAYILIIAYVVLNRLIKDIYTLPVGVSLLLTDIVLAMLLMIWALWMLTQPRPFPAGMAGILGSALLVLMLVSPYINAGNITDFELRGAERGLVRGTLYAGLFVAAYHVATWRDWARRITTLMIGMTVFQGLVAIYEIVVGSPLRVLGQLWLGMGMEVDPRGMRGDSESLGARLTGEVRVEGTAPHPLVLSGLLVASIGLCIARYLSSESAKQRRRYLVAIVVQLVAVAATNERTGFVALAALVLLFAITQTHRLPSAWPLVLACAFGGLVIAVVSPDTPRLILDFFTGRATDHNVTVRTGKYAFVSELLSRRPLIGGGYQTSDPSVILFDNAYLTQLIEMGLLGLLLLLAFLLVVSSRSFSVYARAPQDDQLLLLGAMCASVSLFVTMATFDVLSFDQLFPTSLILLAFGLARADAFRRGTRSPLEQPRTG